MAGGEPLPRWRRSSRLPWTVSGMLSREDYPIYKNPRPRAAARVGQSAARRREVPARRRRGVLLPAGSTSSSATARSTRERFPPIRGSSRGDVLRREILDSTPRGGPRLPRRARLRLWQVRLCDARWGGDRVRRQPHLQLRSEEQDWVCKLDGHEARRRASSRSWAGNDAGGASSGAHHVGHLRTRAESSFRGRTSAFATGFPMPRTVLDSFTGGQLTIAGDMAVICSDGFNTPAAVRRCSPWPAWRSRPIASISARAEDLAALSRAFGGPGRQTRACSTPCRTRW